MTRTSLRDRALGPDSRARIFAGKAKFRTSQSVANRAVPLYRSLRGLRSPIADGHLFVLAHPRSGSTVLTHILHSHPAIAGFGEHHVSYETEADLARLEARVAFFAHEPGLRTPWVLDKLVWNQHRLAPAILRAPSSRFVFLVRRPEETFDSYRRMFPQFPTDADRFRSYRRRMNGLVELAEGIDDPERAFFLTYDDLVDKTDTSLDALTAFLELASPLEPDYGLTSKTGSQSWGDPSENIKAGRILRLDRSSAIDPEVATAADKLYRETVRTIATLTTSPAPTPG